MKFVLFLLLCFAFVFVAANDPVPSGNPDCFVCPPDTDGEPSIQRNNQNGNPNCDYFSKVPADSDHCLYDKVCFIPSEQHEFVSSPIRRTTVTSSRTTTRENAHSR
jgi:hypothetical protein